MKIVKVDIDENKETAQKQEVPKEFSAEIKQFI
ncbi:hypothetical protein SAMN05421687_1196 [Salimicrobium flavidum]|uniref:Uncharacterized protein n=1 Tax=Salimicrobium flavidum TaxID=570947 RepID=A0A1N7KUA6_9BACI|nr:hypothetical protein SAMN05421687_1196 [Salimicrobium flavidum]